MPPPAKNTPVATSSVIRQIQQFDMIAKNNLRVYSIFVVLSQ